MPRWRIDRSPGYTTRMTLYAQMEDRQESWLYYQDDTLCPDVKLHCHMTTGCRTHIYSLIALL